jgi:hypothetical protein
VRSRITFWALAGSFQISALSASAFSSARRRVEASQSKMPPQQSHGLLDRIDKGLMFGAHDSAFGKTRSAVYSGAHLL